MTSSAVGRVIMVLTSAVFAVGLLVFIVVWAALASFVPQGAVNDPRVAEWAARFPGAEAVISSLGLHHAFRSPVFMLAVVLLALSTGLCAWKRTSAARAKARLLRQARDLTPSDLARHHDFAIGLGQTSREDALDVAADCLDYVGVKTRRRGDVVLDVSPTWAVWGSPVFHWALVALILTVPLGTLFRSSGQIGLAVGQSKPDSPASYGLLSAGPLHRWPGANRVVRVDSFDPSYKSGGVNRGATPTVTLLDSAGTVTKTQLVYPNKTLKSGTLTIYPADYGLAAVVSVASADASVTGSGVELMDFSGKAAGGTRPVAPIVVRDPATDTTLSVTVTVPLDRVEGGLAARLPASPRARVVATSSTGQVVFDGEMRPGETAALTSGGSVRLDDLGYYARLQLVDDPSVPVLYAVLVIAVVGLAMATLPRQQVVAAAVVDGSEGPCLAVRVRLVRNASTSRTEIEEQLADAFGGPMRRSDS